MPYATRTYCDRNGKEIKVDKFYTSCLGKKKARKEAGAGTNPGKK